MGMNKIIIDAMGGDNAPDEIIKGTMLAVDEYGIEAILVGDEKIINNCLEKNNLTLKNTKIINAKSVISMTDSAKCVLKEKADSSMAIGFKLLNDGVGNAFVSAGNTGCITVGATLITKRIKGIKRPAIASVMPGKSNPFLLIDCGANSDCRAEFLYQFGQMGSIYMQKILGVESPRVALANNGTESTKGNICVKEAYELMQNAPYNFVGNIEGRQIPYGDCDVVVADGFTGNLVLKMYEGVAKVLLSGIKDAFMKNTLTKLSYLGVKSSLKDMIKQFDYKEYGGAVVLGVKKPVIKAHGSSDAKTFKNAIKQAVRFLENDLISQIEERFAY